MDFGLRAGQHAYRPYAASLPVRVPTVKGLFPASFGLAARLAPRDFRSAVPYGYLHRSRQARFILLESAHAGHTGARLPAGGAAATPSTSPGPRKTQNLHESARKTVLFTRNLQSGRRPLLIQIIENKNTIRFRRRESAPIGAVLAETL